MPSRSLAAAQHPRTSNQQPRKRKETGQLSRKARKQSKAQAAIQAALEIAREHAELIEAAKLNTDREPVDAPTAVTK